MHRVLFAVAVACSLLNVAPAKDKEPSGFRKSGIPGLTGREKIDTSEKPMPSKCYVYPIVANDSYPPDSYGGFTLAKDGSGTASMVMVDGGTRTFIGTNLVGYGSTDEYWFYELKGAQMEGEKVYIGLPKQAPIGGYRDMYISIGHNAPTSTSAFQEVGQIARGTNIVQ